MTLTIEDACERVYSAAQTDQTAFLAEMRAVFDSWHGKVKVKVKAPAKVKVAKAMTGEEFYNAYSAAHNNIAAVHGRNWFTRNLHTWASLPTRLRSFKGPRGGKVSIPRDIRVPPAAYWPDQTIPEGPEFATAVPVLTPWVRMRMPVHNKRVVVYANETHAKKYAWITVNPLEARITRVHRDAQAAKLRLTRRVEAAKVTELQQNAWAVAMFDRDLADMVGDDMGEDERYGISRDYSYSIAAVNDDMDYSEAAD